MTKVDVLAEEKVKPFRIVKYFTFTSLILIFSGSVVMSALNTHWFKKMLREKSENYALVLVENLNHQVFLQFIIPVALKYGKIQLRNKEQYQRMDKVVKSTLHSFKVDMVNIYDKDNTISYSFDTEKIGGKNAGGSGYQDAIAGRSTTRLVQIGNFWEIFLGFPKESKIITFAPLRAEQRLSNLSGPVLGVVEIVQNVTDDFQTVLRLQILILSTCSIVMGILFLVLFFVVRRGEAIIEKRALERIRLKEQLNRAEHFSSLGKLTAGISHEIRNPLGIIRSSAELLKKKIDKLNISSPIPDIIVEEASRLNDIITDFLNFAKPKHPRFSTCRVEQIIEKNLTALAPQIENSGCIVKKHFATGLPEIMADFDMLYQAFLNILINAMQAMPEGGTIHVALETIENIVVILIEDEGDGIPSDLLNQIWDPFLTTKEKGTGLGLGIVRNIIEAHHGSIQIQNRSIRGVQVRIELPADKGV